MWSDPNTIASRVSDGARIASFWDEAPTTAEVPDQRSVVLLNVNSMKSRPEIGCSSSLPSEGRWKLGGTINAPAPSTGNGETISPMPRVAELELMA